MVVAKHDENEGKIDEMLFVCFSLLFTFEEDFPRKRPAQQTQAGIEGFADPDDGAIDRRKGLFGI